MQQRRFLGRTVMGVLTAVYLQTAVPPTVAQSADDDQLANFSIPEFFRGWAWGTPLAEIMAKEGPGILNTDTPDGVQLELLYKNQPVLGAPALVIYFSGPCKPQTPAACTLTRVQIWWAGGLWADYIDYQDERPFEEYYPEHEARLARALGPGMQRAPFVSVRFINGTRISHSGGLEYQSPEDLQLLELHHALINRGVPWRKAMRQAFQDVYGFSEE